MSKFIMSIKPQSEHGFSPNVQRFVARQLLPLILCVAYTLAAETVVAQGYLAITNAQIETVGEAGTLENGTILIQGDKIVEVGEDVDIPVAARVIDAKGKVAIPGIVDPYYVVSISRNTPPATQRTIVFNGRVFVIPGATAPIATTFARVADGLDLQSIDWKPALRSGITDFHLVTGGFAQSAIGVASSMTSLNPPSIVDPDALLLVAVTNDTPTLDVLRNGLNSNESTGSKGDRSPRSGSAQSRNSSRRKGPVDELWTAVRDGESPLFVNVDNASAILHVMSAIEEQEKLKLALIASGPDIYLNIDNLQKDRFTFVIPPRIDLEPNTRRRINVPAMLSEKDLEFVLSLSLGQSDFRAMQHNPLFAVAMLVRGGLDRQIALRALTRGPAELIGKGSEIGSLESGKYANLILFDGDPFNATSAVDQVFVQGKPIKNED